MRVREIRKQRFRRFLSARKSRNSVHRGGLPLAQPLAHRRELILLRVNISGHESPRALLVRRTVGYRELHLRINRRAVSIIAVRIADHDHLVSDEPGLRLHKKPSEIAHVDRRHKRVVEPLTIVSGIPVLQELQQPPETLIVKITGLLIIIDKLPEPGTQHIIRENRIDLVRSRLNSREILALRQSLSVVDRLVKRQPGDLRSLVRYRYERLKPEVRRKQRQMSVLLKAQEHAGQKAVA